MTAALNIYSGICDGHELPHHYLLPFLEKYSTEGLASALKSLLPGILRLPARLNGLSSLIYGMHDINAEEIWATCQEVDLYADLLKWYWQLLKSASDCPPHVIERARFSALQAYNQYAPRIRDPTECLSDMA